MVGCFRWEHLRSQSLADAKPWVLAQLKPLVTHIAKRTSNAVICCDDKRRINWVNEGFVRVTGYELDDTVGKNIFRVFVCSQANTKEMNQLHDAIDKGVFFKVKY
jgi:PAS domain-containing protein